MFFNFLKFVNMNVFLNRSIPGQRMLSSGFRNSCSVFNMSMTEYRKVAAMAVSLRKVLL